MTSLPDWRPFQIQNGVLIAPRPIETVAGIGDRLRTAAFAEVQAEAAFLWAADHLPDAPDELRGAWRHLAREERKHREWLVARMGALHVAIDERPVSDVLWRSLASRQTAREFCHYMADAEERGRRAGARFHERLATVDAETARIFGQIALEEQSHIDLSYRFFPKN